MVLVLAGAGLFVYTRLRSDLDDAIREDLATRARAAPVLVSQPVDDPEDEFVQVLTRSGQVVASTGGAREAALSGREIPGDGPVEIERHVRGTDGPVRVRAVPLGDGRTGVAGQSLVDRNDTLAGVVKSFALGGPVAVLLASALGYALATAGFRPIEAMRVRATQVSVARAGERLPLPRARDEVRQLGETLNAMLERLQQSLKREREFVADAGHELRTPLAVVKAELEAALRSSDTGPEARESLVAALEEVDHLAQLADDLLLIARTGDEPLPLRRSVTDVRELLDRARERFAGRAAERGRLITVDAGDRLSAKLDELRLRQALGNLIDNALRHGAGTVTLRARPVDGAGDYVEIEVSDEGAGFTPELAARAFERFARGDRSRTGSGNGLGLAIVRTITEAHGGSASIAGAAVRLRFPVGA